MSIIYWARKLGGTKAPLFTDYPHGDWRIWHFLLLSILYLTFTHVSEFVLGRLNQRLSRDQATLGGTGR